MSHVHALIRIVIASLFLLSGPVPPRVSGSGFAPAPDQQHAPNRGAGCRAIGAWVQVKHPGPKIRIYADTGDRMPAAGNASASLASITDNVFTTGPVSCGAQDSDTLAASFSAVAGLSAFAGTAGALTCAAVRADARSACSGATASSTIRDLVFAAVPVSVTGEANQTISVPGVATLVINEQSRAGTPGKISVNALHLVLNTGQQLIVCSAQSDIIPCATPARATTWGGVKAIYR